MAKKQRRRTAIVPKVLFTVALASGAGIVPVISSCGFHGGVAADFAVDDLSRRDLSQPPVGLDVAAADFATTGDGGMVG